MDYYNEYDMCYVISLSSSDGLEVRGNNLQHYNNAFIHSLRYQLGFQFNKETGEVMELREERVDERDIKNTITVKNLVEEIYRLYLQEESMQHDGVSFAISKYFAYVFGEICAKYRLNLTRLFFVFVLPDHWLLKSFIISRVLVPILRVSGLELSNYYRNEVMFISNVAGSLFNLQLNKELPIQEAKRLSATSEEFLGLESRVMLHDIVFDADSVEFRSVYFKLKEDNDLTEDLDLFRSRRYDYVDIYFAPDIIQIYDSEPIRLKNWLKLVTHLVSQSNMDKTPLATVAEDFELGYKKVDDFIIHKKFIKVSLFLSRLVDSVKAQFEHIPFFRKYSILNGCFDNDSIYSRILYDLLKKALIVDIEEQWKIQPSAVEVPWSYISAGLKNTDAMLGAFLALARKAFLVNKGLAPKIIAETRLHNSLGLPFHTSPNKGPSSRTNSLKYITYLDISSFSTTVVCKSIDDKGFVKSQYSIGTTELLPFEEFSDEMQNKVAKLKETDSYSIKNISFSKKLVNRPSKIEASQLNFINYMMKLIELIQRSLEQHQIEEISVGYVLCLDKSMMNSLYLETRDDLLEFIKVNKLIDFTENPRKLVVVNQGDDMIYNRIQNNFLRPLSYYVQTDVKDDYMYLKLSQVVNSSESDYFAEELENIDISDKVLYLENIYDQLKCALWTHITSLGDVEKKQFVSSVDKDFIQDLSSYSAIDRKDIKSMIEGLFQDQFMQSHSDLAETRRKFDISNDLSISITMKEFIDIAIIPVIKRLTWTLKACFLNSDIFEQYDISMLFVTTNFLKIKYCSNLYNYILKNEMEHELQQIIRETTYRTRLDLNVSTCESKPFADQLENNRHVAFGYDRIVKGELRAVSDATYFIRGKFLYSQNRPSIRMEPDSQLKCGYSNSILLRGEKLKDKQIRVNASVIPNQYYTADNQFMLEIFKYDEPSSLSAIQNIKVFLQPNTIYTQLSDITSSPQLFTINITPLYYRSSIRISCESLSVDKRKRPVLNEGGIRIAGRQNAKYF